MKALIQDTIPYVLDVIARLIIVTADSVEEEFYQNFTESSKFNILELSHNRKIDEEMTSMLNKLGFIDGAETHAAVEASESDASKNQPMDAVQVSDIQSQDDDEKKGKVNAKAKQKSKTSRATAAESNVSAESGATQQTYTKEDLLDSTKFPNEKLRTILKGLGLLQKGKKEELVERILEAQKSKS